MTEDYANTGFFCETEIEKTRPDTRHKMRLREGVTERQTDRRTDGRTEDTPFNECASKQLSKRKFFSLNT